MKIRWLAGLTVALLAGASSGSAQGVADLSLTASATPEPVGVGSNLVYSLTVSNAGPSAATGLVQMVMQPSVGDELTNFF